MLAWMQNSRSSRSTKVSKTKLIGLILGPVLFFILLVSPAPEGLPNQGKLVAGITLWLVVWWVTGAVYLCNCSITSGSVSYNRSLIPTSGGCRIHEPNEYFFLLGMFLVVLAVEKFGLQRKVGYLGSLAFSDIHPRE